LDLEGRMIEAESDRTQLLIYNESVEKPLIIQENVLYPISDLTFEPLPKERVMFLNVIVTGYSSDPSQTDSTPFVTAKGTFVRDGIVATNLLPFGAKIKIPEIYGDKIFVVEDRMHPRNVNYVDVWFPTYQEAKSFGVKRTYIEVLE
jgi:3D (Asp-Asp-Asp) domain-containing protein